MLSNAAVKALQQQLFTPNNDDDDVNINNGRKTKKTKKQRSKKSRSKKKPKQRLNAALDEGDAVMRLVKPSHKSDAFDYSVSMMLDQRKRDYLSKEAMRMMSDKKEWVGSPSSCAKLTFSRTANYHVVNKQDMLNYDRCVLSFVRCCTRTHVCLIIARHRTCVC